MNHASSSRSPRAETLKVVDSLIYITSSNYLIQIEGILGIYEIDPLFWISVAFSIDLVMLIILEIFIIKNGVIMWEVMMYLIPLVINLSCWLAVRSLWREVREQVGAPSKVGPERSTQQDSLDLGKI